MIRDIITYPTPPSVAYATDVRIFNEEISSLIQDIKETIEANSADALAAFQIGSYYNIVVVKKDDGTFLELINPRLIKQSGSITTTEKTAYFPNLSAEVTRYKDITVVYQDRELNQHSLEASGNFSILLQRKIDYVFGSSFLNKLSKEEKKRFKKKLEFGSDVAISEICPTTFKKDYITKVINVLMIIMVVLFGSLFFIDKDLSKQIFQYQKILLLLGVMLNIIYFFYAQYEGKKFTSCTSCQIGNIIGTTIISFLRLLVIFILSYFLV